MYQLQGGFKLYSPKFHLLPDIFWRLPVCLYRKKPCIYILAIALYSHNICASYPALYSILCADHVSLSLPLMYCSSDGLAASLPSPTHQHLMAEDFHSRLSSCHGAFSGRQPSLAQPLSLPIAFLIIACLPNVCSSPTPHSHLPGTPVNHPPASFLPPGYQVSLNPENQYTGHPQNISTKNII